MGAIKPAYIKKLAKQLIRDVDDFTDDFDVNKNMVEEYTNIRSKGVRNRVAGYIARKKKGSGEED
ncbi:MAG: 30S ribosomal protein S17e [Euryarchaeota archaeon]|nr:30S ribosomal protein S17e [Euryarchaeota archaeon]